MIIMIIELALLILLCSAICIFSIAYYRRIAHECKKRYIEAFDNPVNFWFEIDDLWKESKLPGNEPLHQAIIGFVLSFILPFLLAMFTLFFLSQLD